MEKSGYHSRTTNIFILGIIGPGSWVGDEIVL